MSATQSEDPTRVDIHSTGDDRSPFVRRMSGVAIHGNTPFDVPFITRVEGNLYVGGCEPGLILPQVIKHVVSLYTWEQYRVKHDLTSYTQVKMFDSDEIPSMLHGLAAWAVSCVEDAPTLIHCQAGLNRSPLVTTLVLNSLGRTIHDSIELMRSRRSPAVLCNPNFLSWLRSQEA